MKNFALVITLVFFSERQAAEGYGTGKKTKCFSIPTLPKKVEQVIKSCQDEVKTNLIEDLLFAALNENPFEPSKHQHVLQEFEDHLFTHHDPSHLALTPSHDHHHHHPADPSHHVDLHPHTDHHSVHSVLANLNVAPISNHQVLTTHHHPHVHTPHLNHPLPDTIHPLTTRHNPNPPIEHHLNPHPHVHDHHQTDSHFHQTGLSQPIVPLEVGDHHKLAGTTYHAVDVVEAHEALTHEVLAKQPGPHDNHQHLTKILHKLRKGPEDSVDLKWHRRSRRSLFGKWTTTKEDEQYHPTVISHEDKWLAGCLMQCVYRKNNAVDKFGYPTLDGLTDLYTNGNNEQGFFIHVLKSVDKCLKAASVKHNIHKGKAPLKGETCDVAFDVFDCVSDSITEYCSSV